MVTAVRSVISADRPFGSPPSGTPVATTVTRPADWRGYACTFGGILGLPVMPLVMAGAFMHFIHEQRFNRDLLYDLLAKPTEAARVAAELAA